MNGLVKMRLNGETSNRVKVVIIAGPTASGKSALAMELSELFDGEIINADSMQVYRYMDIGTAKPTPEQRKRIAHHLIDVTAPDEEFTAARYATEAAKAINDIHARGKNIFVAGGTGLYIRALTKGLFKGPGTDKELRREFILLARSQDQIGSDGARYLYERLKEVDPESAARIHPNNIVRVIRALEVYHLANKPISAFQMEHGFSEEPYETIKVGLMVDRKVLYKRIDDRVDSMMKNGLLEEVRRLLARGYSPSLKAMGGLGYKEIIQHLQNECTLEEAVGEIKKNTRRYAKRQMTWFKKEADIKWFPYERKDEIISLLDGFFKVRGPR